MEGKVSAEAVSDKMQWIKNKMDEMLTIDSQNELVDIYTEIVAELGTCYAALTSAIMSSEKVFQSDFEAKTSTEPAKGEVETSVESVEEDNELQPEENEQESATETETIAERNIDEDIEQDTMPTQAVEDDAPAYAVFYSLNNAAYVAINERMRACVPVRNLAKAYCVEADLTSVAQGQNELSKYNLDKLKPIQIKFLTQREYDDTIGKAKAMQELMANMPKVENTNTNTEHRVTNFAANNKTSSSGHIGEKTKNNTSGYYSDSYHSGYYNDSYGKKKEGYDFFRANPYGLSKTGNQAPVPSVSKITMTDMIENPRELYKAMHDGIDDTAEIGRPCSYENDIIDITPTVYAELDDFEILIPAINATIDAISRTKAGWLVDPFVASGKEIDNDYMMDIDYSLLDLAIQDWNEINAPFQIMYVEDFDPTVISFKKNIQAVAKKYVVDEEELAAMAIYNYVRCLMAYESFKTRRGIIT